MKYEKRPITGVLLLDKPIGISSNAAVNRVKLLYRAEKAGHTGTLDPFASGLLPVCLGEATKFAGFMLNANKSYEAVIRLGRVTTTGDREGEVLADRPVHITEAAVRDVLVQFVGRIHQTPPMFSALKFQGQPLYRLARQGIEIPRDAREVTIDRLDLLMFEPPFAKIFVTCSKGTYIRVLGEDIGHALGCGGCLEELRRTQIGDFTLNKALILEELAELSVEARDIYVADADRLVSHLPRVHLDECFGQALLMGRSTEATFGLQSGVYCAYGPMDEFFGLVDVADGVMKARRMMSRAFPRRNVIDRSS